MFPCWLRLRLCVRARARFGPVCTASPLLFPVVIHPAREFDSTALSDDCMHVCMYWSQMIVCAYSFVTYDCMHVCMYCSHRLYVLVTPHVCIGHTHTGPRNSGIRQKLSIGRRAGREQNSAAVRQVLRRHVHHGLFLSSLRSPGHTLPHHSPLALGPSGANAKRKGVAV